MVSTSNTLSLVRTLGGIKARDGGNSGTGPRRHHDIVRHDPAPCHLHAALVGEPGDPLDHRDAEPLEALHGVMRLDRRDHGAHMRVHARSVNFEILLRNVGKMRRTVGVREFGYGQERLGRHAAGVQAIATHTPGLDQDRRQAQLHGAGGERQTGRAGPDDAEIKVLAFLHRKIPLRQTLFASFPRLSATERFANVVSSLLVLERLLQITSEMKPSCRCRDRSKVVAMGWNKSFDEVEVLAEAAKHFWRHGYTGTTIRDLEVALFLIDIVEGSVTNRNGCLPINSATEITARDAELREDVEESLREIEEALCHAVTRGQAMGSIFLKCRTRNLRSLPSGHRCRALHRVPNGCESSLF